MMLNSLSSAVRRISLRRLLTGALTLALCPIAAFALAGDDHVIVQKDRSFSVKEIAIASGEILHFINQDPFLHQIYVASGNLDYDSAEQPPGQTISIKFPNAGTFEIRCHIHPKMSLVVTVK